MPETISLTGVTEFSSVSADREKRLLLLAHMKAPTVEPKEDAVRAPVRVSAVIDVSGSMAGEKLQLVKETLLFVISELGAADQLGVVTFHSAVDEVFPVLSMTPENKERAAAVVRGINSQGCTNLSGGLLKGLSQITRELPTSKTVSSVWLFTDGMANEGLTSTSDIVNAMLPAINTEVAPTVFTFGFGTGHSEDMLRAVAEAGQGMYYYISSPDTIPTAFAESLGGLMSVVGQNVHLTVTAAEGVRIAALLTRQQQQSVADGVATMRLKDFFSEEERDIVLEVEVSRAKPGKQSVCTLELTYTDNTGKSCSVKMVAEIDRVGGEVDEETVLNEEVDAHRNRILVVDAIDEARKLADTGDLHKATEELKATVARVQKSKSSDQKLSRDLVEDANLCLQGLQRQQDYGCFGRKQMTQMGSCHQWQKPCGAPQQRYTNAFGTYMVGRQQQQQQQQQSGGGGGAAVQFNFQPPQTHPQPSKPGAGGFQPQQQQQQQPQPFAFGQQGAAGNAFSFPQQQQQQQQPQPFAFGQQGAAGNAFSFPQQQQQQQPFAFQPSPQPGSAGSLNFQVPAQPMSRMPQQQKPQPQQSLSQPQHP